jgi:hypothetical protein
VNILDAFDGAIKRYNFRILSKHIFGAFYYIVKFLYDITREECCGWGGCWCGSEW